VSNSDLLSLVTDTDDQWIYSHTGIAQRHFAGEGETTASLGAEACLRALSQSPFGDARQPVDPKEVNLVICATASPDYANFPADACLIQERIGAKNAAAFDLASACTGFINGLATADALLRRNAWRYALVCGAETLSRILDMGDRNTAILFGDGAAAVLLENTAAADGAGDNRGDSDNRGDTTEEKGIGAIVLGADGSGAGSLYCKRGGCMTMDGKEVYLFAIRIIPEVIGCLMEKEGFSLEDVDIFLCHQANARILMSAAKRLAIPSEKMFCNIARYGNTSSASIPLCLADLAEEGKLHAGQLLVAAGFGAGLTWGGCVIRL
jgi:3-oxoacyl-[acyl-carrier-protein] synthase-3